uniref:Uncharacterized protein n=1 Tax=Parascaris equorum TaxID=6256 RepID=A0A914RV56_PAREQ
MKEGIAYKRAEIGRAISDVTVCHGYSTITLKHR